jgi:hypothetical protein
MSAGFFGPAFTAAEGGNRSVVYNWNITWTVNASITGRGFVAVDISLIGNLFDNTTGLWTFGGTSNDGVVWTNLNASTPTCRPSSSWSWLCADHVSQDARLSLHASLVRGDQYFFYSGVSVTAHAHATSVCYRGCSRSAVSIEVNIGSDGNRAELRSIHAS